MGGGGGKSGEGREIEGERERFVSKCVCLKTYSTYMYMCVVHVHYVAHACLLSFVVTCTCVHLNILS